MSRLALAALALAPSLALGCGLMRDLLPQRSPGAGIVGTVTRLTREVVGEQPGTVGPDAGGDGASIAVLGFRDEDGKQTSATQVLDGHLLRALLRDGAPVAPGVGVMRQVGSATASWKKDAFLPTDPEALSSPLLLGGRVYRDSLWVYVRLVLAESETGTVLQSHVERFPERELARAARALEQESSSSGSPVAESPFAVAVDLHVVVWRVSGSFTDPVELREGATLAVGDRLQLRYTTDADCVVWAFIFRSDGSRQDLIDITSVYAKHEQMSADFTFEAENVVHTLYFAVADEIDSDRSDLFNEIGELIRRGEVRRFEGFELIDQELVSHLAPVTEARPAPVEVIRGHDGIELGAEETLSIGETNLTSKPERLAGSPVLLRAITFDVQ